jgi:hypothetical protein
MLTALQVKQCCHDTAAVGAHAAALTAAAGMHFTTDGAPLPLPLLALVQVCCTH